MTDNWLERKVCDRFASGGKETLWGGDKTASLELGWVTIPCGMLRTKTAVSHALLRDAAVLFEAAATQKSAAGFKIPALEFLESCLEFQTQIRP